MGQCNCMFISISLKFTSLSVYPSLLRLRQSRGILQSRGDNDKHAVGNVHENIKDSEDVHAVLL